MTQTVLLGDIATIHDKKRIPLNSRQRAERQGNIPYYGATGILDYVDEPLFDGEYVLIGEDGENLRSKKSDLAFKVSGKFWVNNHAHILQGNEPWINDYIVNVFRALDIAPYITGAAQPKLNQAALMRIPIYWPGEESTKKIADMLGTIDEKIELNRKMNETLEQIGQALFRHYFVTNPEAEKWEVGQLGDLFEVTMGQSPPGSSYNENKEGITFYQGRAEFGVRFPNKRLSTVDPKRLAKRGDTLLSVRAPVGDINQATEDCCIGRGLAAISGGKERASFCYYTCRSLQSKLAEYNSEGTVFGAINGKQLKALKTKLPTSDVIDDFEQQASEIDEQILNNSQQIQTLTTLRDTLLPQLISGKVRV